MLYLTAYQLVHRADSVQRYCLYTILQNYSQIFTFSGLGRLPRGLPRQRAKCPGNLRSRAHHPLASHALRTRENSWKHTPLPKGKVSVKLTLRGTSSSGFTGPSHPVRIHGSIPLTPEGKVSVKLTLPGTSSSGFAGPHCGRCPLEVDTYCDIGFFCCRWCWYRDTYSGGLAPQVVSGKLFSERLVYYFHTPICNYLETKELENGPWK